MAKSSTSKDVQALFQSLHSAYAATPTNLKIIDLYIMFALFTALIQVIYMAIVGTFPFNSFLSGVLSCIGTAVLAVCLRIQVNKDNKEFKQSVHAILDSIFTMGHPETVSLWEPLRHWGSTS
ncbi:unnamed protein product [Cuscuta epithymum]|uniref:Dolichyl-diphosphooligosaccharide--protein glycosyltransferase subunit DAD1 n=1 Tax=Cuscuta epithymum TaxID=186058 RepID=A0AAV0CGJ7_9ASTE|nr:unnamed protein product [Cuscuta epithymum]CAH9121737.1 unnamed protein product [Cuscuta epithymum]